MKNATKNISILLLVLLVGLASYSIPLKINHISKKETSQTLSEIYTQVLSKIDAGSSLFLASVAGSTQSISKALKNQPLNVFNLEPLSYLRIQAPLFNLLPLFFSTTTKTPISTIPSLQNKITSPEPLNKSLIQVSTPISTITAKKEARPEDGVVNIFCSQKIVVNGKVTSQRRTITGSGALISKDGVVLTNAHVAQFPLLADKNPNIVCLARYGNPASGSLSVKVSYISPEWVKEYGKYINTEGAPQSGKSDFALLKISLPTGNTGNSPLFPLTLQKSLPDQSATIYSVSYPADILGAKGVNSSLPLQKEALGINRFYSVGVTSNDVIETTPSSAGQRGSSGGAIVDQQGQLIGTITTIVNSSNPSKKLIRAMTITHTDVEFSKFSNTNLSQVTTYGIAEAEKSFDNQYREFLTSLLTNYLNSL